MDHHLIAGLTLALALPLAVSASSPSAPRTPSSPPGQVHLASHRSGGPGGHRPKVSLPPGAAVFDDQIGGAYPPVPAVRIVERDRSDPPVAGLYSICYVNSFQTQQVEDGWWMTNHPDLLLRSHGALVADPNWSGEYLLDTSSASKRLELAAVMGTWYKGCALRGYQAVEADNLDSWTRSGGLLSEADNVAMARMLAQRAHADGLAMVQKNAPQLASEGRRIGFDFAEAEECQVYDECGSYTAAYGSRVLEIEYDTNGTAAFDKACSIRSGHASIILRDVDITPAGQPGYVYRWC
jgi:hypothetical protein